MKQKTLPVGKYTATELVKIVKCNIEKVSTPEELDEIKPFLLNALKRLCNSSDIVDLKQVKDWSKGVLGKHSEFRRAIIHLIGIKGTVNDIDFLLNELNGSDEWCRESSVVALTNILRENEPCSSRKEELSLVIKNKFFGDFKDESVSVRSALCWSMKDLLGDVATDILNSVISNDDSEEVRDGAREALDS